MIERIHATSASGRRRASATRSRRTAHGTALLTPSLPLVWQVNAIRVEDAGADADELAEEADEVQAAFAHRKVVVHDEALGRAAGARLREASAGTSSAC